MGAAGCRSFILSVLVAMLLLTPAPSRSAALPSDDDVSGIVKACAGGRFQQIEGDLEAKIAIWKRNAELSGKASKEDLGAILKEVPQNQQISSENYKTYTDCILNAMSKYLKSENIIRGRLVPAQYESPPALEQCKRALVPGGVAVYFGNRNMVIVRTFPHTVLRINKRDVLVVNKTDDGYISINLEILGDDGREIVKLENNIFTVNRDNSYEAKWPDMSSLIVQDRQRTTVLDVRYLNEAAIKITGVVRYAGHTIALVPQGLGGKNCFVNAEKDDVDIVVGD